MIEARVRELAEVFAVGVYAFAWMANHFHLALAVRPDAVRAWSDEEVVDRWQRAYRSKCEKANAESLSWFMKCLNEHVSRIANAEDQACGHFWEARFKSQVLLNERALLAAMAYVYFNPIRAGIAHNLMGSRNTSIRQRCKAVRGNPELAAELVRPIWGVAACTMPPITVGDYIELVDDTGRQVRKDKRGAISAAEPRVLEKLCISPEHWTRKVKGVGSGFWRVVGTVDEIQEKAAAMQQQFLRGIGFAKGLIFG